MLILSGMTCVIQISSWRNDYIIDPFLTYDSIVSELRPFLENGNVLKIFHGAVNDVIALHRDFDTHILGAIDTQEVYQVLRTDNKKGLISFQKAVDNYLKFNVDKTYQNCDWRIRPLTHGMTNYARNDSHLLLRLWNVLRGEVLLYLNTTE